MLAAVAEEAAVHGVGDVTVTAVVARAGVSRRLFYEHFADLEACLLAAFEWALAQARAAAAEPFLAEDDWHSAVRAGLAALLRFFDAQPALARLCVVHALAGGPRVLARRAEAVAELCALVDRGRSHPSAPARSSARADSFPVVAEGVVGAVLAILYAHLLDGGSPPPKLIELHGELMSVIALPYLGAAAAARELEREPPPPAG